MHPYGVCAFPAPMSMDEHDVEREGGPRGAHGTHVTERALWRSHPSKRP